MARDQFKTLTQTTFHNLISACENQYFNIFLRHTDVIAHREQLAGYTLCPDSSSCWVSSSWKYSNTSGWGLRVGAQSPWAVLKGAGFTACQQGELLCWKTVSFRSLFILLVLTVEGVLLWNTNNRSFRSSKTRRDFDKMHFYIRIRRAAPPRMSNDAADTGRRGPAFCSWAAWPRPTCDWWPTKKHMNIWSQGDSPNAHIKVDLRESVVNSHCK